MWASLLGVFFAAIARFAIAAIFSRKKEIDVPESKAELEDTLKNHDL